MTDAERRLLVAIAASLAAAERIDWRLLRAVLDEQAERERLDAAIARGRMLAAAMD